MNDNDTILPRQHAASSPLTPQPPLPPHSLQSAVSAPVTQMEGGRPDDHSRTNNKNNNTQKQTVVPTGGPLSAFTSPSPFRSRHNSTGSSHSNGTAAAAPGGGHISMMMTIQRARSLDEQALSESGGSNSARSRGHTHSIFNTGNTSGSKNNGLVRRHPTQRFLFGEDFTDGTHHGGQRQHHSSHHLHHEALIDDYDDGENDNNVSSSSVAVGAGAALHSSFDASLLRGSDGSSFHVETFDHPLCPKGQADSTNLTEFSGRKHYLRPRTPVDGSPDATTKQPPRTVRKTQTRQNTADAVDPYIREEEQAVPSLPGQQICTTNDIYVQANNDSGSSGLFLTTDTPGRPRPRRLSTTPKPTPGTTASQSSSAKRRRAPSSYRLRQSPMRRVPPNTPSQSFFGNNVPSSIRNTASSAASPFATDAPGYVDGTHGFSWNNQNGLSWPHESDTSEQTGKRMPSLTPVKTSLIRGSLFGYEGGESGTAQGEAPGSSQLEATFDTTDESKSADTNSPARFRFSAFPASLPRVNNLRSSIAYSTSRQNDDVVYPGSVRKHMTFSELTEYDETNNGTFGTSVAAASSHLNNATNKSELSNQSRDDDGTQNTSFSSLSADGGGAGHHKHLPDIPGQTYPSSSILFRSESIANDNLFEDDDEIYGDNQDIEIGRTRLDFNCPIHESSKGQNSNTVASQHSPLITNFCASKSTNDPLAMNVDLSRPYDYQKRISSFPSSLSSNTQMNLSDEATPLSPPGRSGLRSNQPDTPREVQFHFPPEAECSPILNLSEQRNHLLGHNERDLDDSALLNRNDDSSSCSSGLIGDGLLLPVAGTSSAASSLAESSTKNSNSSKKDSASLGSDGTQQRSVRPMPDMSAFESVACQSRDRSRDDTSATGVGSTQRRVCPPTPQRTPAWQGGKHSFFSQRSNSLVSTKVLLAAPSQVLKGRSSLESTVLDNDNVPAQKDSNKTAPNNPRDLTSPPGSSELQKLSDGMDLDDEHGTQLQRDDSEPENINDPPRLLRRLPSPVPHDQSSITGSSISFTSEFEILGLLGSGNFADVYKVRARSDGKLYAVKRNRRQFRGKRDREMALAEVQSMQRLQSALALQDVMAKETSYSLYLLFFYRAWQEDGYFYSQTELCCKDTCRELLDSLRLTWADAKRRYPSLAHNVDVIDAESESSVGIVPTGTIWKICHDITAGLSHVHANGIVHLDIKPSNIFFVANPRFGAMAKIGDFGSSGDIESAGDGLEGDARYMSPELLSSSTRHPSSDIFSFGLTLYEIASELHIDMPSEGPQWHQLRSNNEPRLPFSRGKELEVLVQSMTNPKHSSRPTADQILENANIKAAGRGTDVFLRDYLQDVQAHEDKEAELRALEFSEEKTPRQDMRYSVRSPSLSMMIPAAPNLLSPAAVGKR